MTSQTHARDLPGKEPVLLAICEGCGRWQGASEDDVDMLVRQPPMPLPPLPPPPFDNGSTCARSFAELYTFVVSGLLLLLPLWWWSVLCIILCGSGRGGNEEEEKEPVVSVSVITKMSSVFQLHFATEDSSSFKSHKHTQNNNNSASKLCCETHSGLKLKNSTTF